MYIKIAYTVGKIDYSICRAGRTSASCARAGHGSGNHGQVERQVEGQLEPASATDRNKPSGMRLSRRPPADLSPGPAMPASRSRPRPLAGLCEPRPALGPVPGPGLGLGRGVWLEGARLASSPYFVLAGGPARAARWLCRPVRYGFWPQREPEGRPGPPLRPGLGRGLALPACQERLGRRRLWLAVHTTQDAI
jgi:hypothetical protein